MKIRSFILLILLVGGPLPGSGQQVGIDPVAVSPDIFKVLLENEHVRVVEYTLVPGQRDEWHTHPPKMSYVISGGTLRITPEDGPSFITEEGQGAASWMEALGRHYAENVGQTPVRILLVEVKSTASEIRRGAI
jgi:quercetin dioxygenase-like cupin family protein